MTSSVSETTGADALCGLQWQWFSWSALGAGDVHDFLKLRAEIFIVEQHCAYQDIDGLDPGCRHLLVRDTGGHLLGYLRLLPPGLTRAEPALGRLVVVATARNSGLGRALMIEGIRLCTAGAPMLPIYIHAQEHLRAFYASLGFHAASEIHLEDGIPHIDMLRPPQAG